MRRIERFSPEIDLLLSLRGRGVSLIEASLSAPSLIDRSSTPSLPPILINALLLGTDSTSGISSTTTLCFRWIRTRWASWDGLFKRQFCRVWGKDSSNLCKRSNETVGFVVRDQFMRLRSCAS